MEDVIPIQSIKNIIENHIFYTADRAEWRAWLEEHFDTEKEQRKGETR